MVFKYAWNIICMRNSKHALVTYKAYILEVFCYKISCKKSMQRNREGEKKDENWKLYFWMRNLKSTNVFHSMIVTLMYKKAFEVWLICCLNISVLKHCFHIFMFNISSHLERDQQLFLWKLKALMILQILMNFPMLISKFVCIFLIESFYYFSELG